MYAKTKKSTLKTPWNFSGVLVLFILYLPLQLTAQSQWLSLSKMLEQQQNHPKKVLLFFTENNCTLCLEMEKKTLGHPQIQADLIAHYYTVKIDIHSTEPIRLFGRDFSGALPDKSSTVHEFARFMNVSSTPTLVLLDEQLMPLTTLQGGLNARELEPYLRFFSSGAHEKLATPEQWEHYRKKMRSEITP